MHYYGFLDLRLARTGLWRDALLVELIAPRVEFQRVPLALPRKPLKVAPSSESSSTMTGTFLPPRFVVDDLGREVDSDWRVIASSSWPLSISRGTSIGSTTLSSVSSSESRKSGRDLARFPVLRPIWLPFCADLAVAGGFLLVGTGSSASASSSE